MARPFRRRRERGRGPRKRRVGRKQRGGTAGEPSCVDYAARTYHRGVTLTLDAEARARVLDFVRPLSVGLDGVTNFGFVERRLRISENLLEGEEGRSGAA